MKEVKVLKKFGEFKICKFEDNIEERGYFYGICVEYPDKDYDLVWNVEDNRPERTEDELMIECLEYIINVLIEDRG